MRTLLVSVIGTEVSSRNRKTSYKHIAEVTYTEKHILCMTARGPEVNTDHHMCAQSTTSTAFACYPGLY